MKLHTIASLGFVVALATVGCARHVVVHEHVTTTHRHGPPPHAPAHGYRHKAAHGVECAYDSSLGVYVVLGRRDHYYDGDRFYRRSSGQGEVSVELEGSSWRVVSETSVPEGLRTNGKGKAKHKHKK